MSNHGHEGYNYAGLNATFRKLRRLELQHDRNVHKFVHTQDSINQVQRMLATLEAEQDSFTSYYYNTPICIPKTVCHSSFADDYTITDTLFNGQLVARAN